MKRAVLWTLVLLAVMLARPDGSVIWRKDGQFTDAAYGALKTAIRKALSGGAKN